MKLSEPDLLESVSETTRRLMKYCRRNDWAGHDPYDALTSGVYSRIALAHNKACRIALIQLLKRSPINLRWILRVPKTCNPKGLALFSSSLLRLSEIGLSDDIDEPIALLERLLQSRSEHPSYSCWGYDFDWQTRTVFIPRGEPNVIATTFAGNAVLDFYDKIGDPSLLDVAASAGRFILKTLANKRRGDEVCFSYTALATDHIHNANLLAAAYLSRLYGLTQEKLLFDYASMAVRYSARRQRLDGSWPYGEAPHQTWIDSFHTGFNLVALKAYSIYSGSTEYMNSLEKGFSFYVNNFFGPHGEAYYFHERKYPIDIHSIAQGIVTLCRLHDLDHRSMNLASSLFRWSARHMRSRDGSFYYQKWPLFTNRISYMRWSQAWMLYALAILASSLNTFRRTLTSADDDGREKRNHRHSDTPSHVPAT
jgi:hypothetical protein